MTEPRRFNIIWLILGALFAVVVAYDVSYGVIL